MKIISKCFRMWKTFLNDMAKSGFYINPAGLNEDKRIFNEIVK